MPKPVFRGIPKRPQNFIPGYYCPICEEPIPIPPGQTWRPKLFHDKCKPGRTDPNRRLRICPGCGLHYTADYGSNTAYCGQECKNIYIAHHSGEKTAKKICFCSQPQGGTRNARQYRLCTRHAYYMSFIVGLQRVRKGVTERIFSYDQALNMITHDLQGLPTPYYTNLRNAELAMPPDQKTWPEILPERNPSNRLRNARKQEEPTMEQVQAWANAENENPYNPDELEKRAKEYDELTGPNGPFRKADPKNKDLVQRGYLD